MKFADVINRNKNTNTKESKVMQNAENRKLTLEVAGINTDSYISLKLANGETITVNGNGQVASEDLQKLVGGNIANPHLFRRWVMAQWFRQNNNPEGYSYVVSHLSLAYQWKVVANELKTLAKLQKSDPRYFEERSQFFTLHSVWWMLMEYAENLEKTLATRPTKHCKGVPHIKFAGQDIFCDDVDKKILFPVQKAIETFRVVADSNDYTQASRQFDRINANFLKKYRTNEKYVGSTFKDAYKGAGAYYTLQNMVLNHGVGLTEYDSHTDKPVKTRFGGEAYEWMKSQLGIANYRWTGILRRCITDNNFSWNKGRKTA